MTKKAVHNLAFCSIARVTISSFIVVIVGAIISMKTADCSAHRNQEPQFPPLVSTPTGVRGLLAL